jgi:uncharacterized protein (TIGR02284 family)
MADNADVIDTLNDLIEIAHDGEYGFKESAENAKSPELKGIFGQRAQDCRTAAQELVQQVVALGGKPEDGGTVAGALHRGWVSVRSVLTTSTDQAILDEAERGEDAALAAYRKALKQPLPDAIRTLVERQQAGAQRNHDQIKALRDQHRAAT